MRATIKVQGLSVGFFLFYASLGMAQLTRGTITGTVTDQSGGAVPGATVTVTNVETGVSRQTTTGPQGHYEAPNLPVGGYEVRTTVPGFQTSVRAGIELSVGRTAVVDHVMEVGEVTQAVTVTGEVTFVETTTATVTNLVDERKVADLPLNNRDLTQLTYLQPGVLAVPGSGRQRSFSGMGSKLTVGGARTSDNRYLLDGVNNGDLSGNAQGATSGYMGAETVQEFQVITNNYSAEYESAAGAIISAVTKSGTNAFHGSLFEFLRNDNFDAAKWEDNAFGGRKAEFKRNQFGGSVGGPIFRDKTFFFGSYEGLRERLAENDTAIVPSLDVHRGIVAGEVVAISPRAAPYLALYPKPGDGNSLVQDFGDGSTLISGGRTTPTTDDFMALKIDHNLSDNHQLSGTFNFDDADRPGPCGILCDVSNEANIGQGFASSKKIVSFGLTSILSPTSVNEFHFGFSSTNPQSEIRLSSIDTSALRYNDTEDFFGLIEIDDPAMNFIGSDSDGYSFLLESLTFKDSVSLSRGNHSFRLGGEVTRGFFDQRTCSDCAGSFRFTSLQNFLRAIPLRSEMPIADAQGRGVSRPHLVHQWKFGAFFQDNWQARSDFTLNLGLRYEFVTIPAGDEARMSALRDYNDPEATVGAPWTNPTKRSFSPRVGFAWAPGDGRTSLRGGVGVYYVHPSFFELRNGLQFMPPELQLRRLDARNGNIRGVVDGSGNPIPLLFPNAFFAGQFNLVSPQFSIRGNEYELPTTYSYRWSLTLQREMADWVFSAGYTGSRARHLWNQNRNNVNRWVIKEDRDPNSATVGVWPANPQPGQYKYWPGEDEPDYIGVLHNPRFSTFQMMSMNADSEYHGLSVGAQKRLGYGLQVQMAYSLGKMLDHTASQTSTGDELNQGQRGIYGWDMYMKWGPSTIDIRNNMVTNFSYEVPGGNFGGIGNAILNGWQLNGVLTLSDGAPMTTYGETDQNEDRIAEIEYMRPDLRAGFSNNPTEGVSAGCEGGEIFAGREVGTPNLWYDPCAFIPGPAGFFGNLGKNTLSSPGVATFDWSLMKNISITETSRVQFRAEFFNLFNRPNFRVPGDGNTDEFALRSSATSEEPSYNPLAGQIRGTRTSARQIQFGLKYIF